MGILSKMQNRKKSKERKENLEGAIRSSKMDKFVPEFSLLDLLDADWRFFGSRLLVNGEFPVRLNLKLESVNVGFGSDNKPYAEVVYKDRKFGYAKTYRLYQKSAKVVKSSRWEDENADLDRTWREFKRYLTANVVLKRQDGMQYHRILESEYNENTGANIEVLDFEKFFKKEEEFLEKYKDVSFDTFGTYKGVGIFAGCQEDSEGCLQYYNMAKPFSPRTLEFCVGHLTDEAKDNELANEEDFRFKCVEVAVNSPYLSKDWERLPEILYSALKNQMDSKKNGRKFGIKVPQLSGFEKQA